MMDQMISAFIDNEMDLEEKVTFIQTVQKDKSFVDETLALLRQENRLRGQVVERIPTIEIKVFGWKRLVRSFLRPVGLVASSFAGALVLLFLLMPHPTATPITNRFVIYRPDVSHIEITGTFTDWQRIPMQQVGNSGYWEVSLELPQGEHRFTYILEGHQAFPDPTVLARESDDFGGENSVLYVGHKA